MPEVYVLEVIEPVARENGTRYVRRFTFEDREEAYAKFAEAKRFGFEASLADVARRRETVAARA
jgi:hypothetical protein